MREDDEEAKDHRKSGLAIVQKKRKGKEATGLLCREDGEAATEKAPPHTRTRGRGPSLTVA